MQNKPVEMTFRNVGGQWQRVDSQEPEPPTLADILKELDIIIDDKTEFARIKDYENNLEIWYRIYGGKITLQIWNIDSET